MEYINPEVISKIAEFTDDNTFFKEIIYLYRYNTAFLNSIKHVFSEEDMCKIIDSIIKTDDNWDKVNHLKHVCDFDDMFVFSCKNGYLNVIKVLFDKVNPNQSYIKEKSFDMTPFMYACEGGHIDVIEFLMDKVDINIKNHYGNAFSYACRNGYLDIVKLLEKCIDDINVISYDDHNFFMRACYSGNVELVKYLIDKVDVNMKNFHGDNAFIYACKSGNIELVKYLADKIDIHNVNNYGKNVFFTACDEKNIELIYFLVDKIDNNIICQYRHTALTWLCEYGCLDIAEFLIDIIDIHKHGEISPLVSSIKGYYMNKCILQNKRYYDNEYIAKLLLNKYIPGKIYEDCCQAFILSCEYGVIDLVILMIDKITIESRDEGFTIACRKGHMDVVEYLMDEVYG